MVHHRSIGFFGEICTAGLSKYHLWKNVAMKRVTTKKEGEGSVWFFDHFIIAYRHCIVWVLSVHKLYFDCDVAGRSLAIGEVQTLWVHVQKIPKQWKQKT